MTVLLERQLDGVVRLRVTDENGGTFYAFDEQGAPSDLASVMAAFAVQETNRQAVMTNQPLVLQAARDDFDLLLTKTAEAAQQAADWNTRTAGSLTNAIIYGAIKVLVTNQVFLFRTVVRIGRLVVGRLEATSTE